MEIKFVASAITRHNGRGAEMGNKRRFSAGLGCFMFLTLLILFAQPAKARPLIDYDVEEALNNSRWVKVGVVLNSLGSVSEDQKLQSEIISNFTDLEFLLEHLDSRGRSFWGNITKKGIDKIRNNDNILRVHLPINGTTTKVPREINESNNTLGQTNTNKNGRLNLTKAGIILVFIAILFLLIIRLGRRRSK